MKHAAARKVAKVHKIESLPAKGWHLVERNISTLQKSGNRAFKKHPLAYVLLGLGIGCIAGTLAPSLTRD